MVKWRSKGTCTMCNRNYALRVDGGLWKHDRPVNDYWEECPGWKLPPK